VRVGSTTGLEQYLKAAAIAGVRLAAIMSPPNASKVALLAYRASKATLLAFPSALPGDHLLVAPRAKGVGPLACPRCLP